MKCLPPCNPQVQFSCTIFSIELSWYLSNKKHPTCSNMKKVCAFLAFWSVDSWQYAVALTIFLGGRDSNMPAPAFFESHKPGTRIWLASMKAQVLLKIFPESTFHPPKSRNKRMTFWTCQRCYLHMKLPQTWNISQEKPHWKRKGLCNFLD